MKKLTMLLAALLTVMFLGQFSGAKDAVLTPVQRWIDQPDLAEREKARALRPMIDCINVADSRWRAAYARYLNRDRQPDPTLQQRFPEDFDPAVQVRQRLNNLTRNDAYGCRLNLLQKDHLQRWAPQLLALQNQFETSLTLANEAAQGFDFFNTVPAYSLSPAEKAERDAGFLPLVEAYLKASDALRRQLDIEDIALRQVQLEQLRGRGELKYAHVLTYMLQARKLMLSLDHAVAENTLTPADLDPQPLQQAWDDGAAYMAANPATSNADYPEKIWAYVRDPGSRYVSAVVQLRDDWAAKAAPQQLSDDVERIGRRYDELLQVYNRQVEPVF